MATRGWESVKAIVSPAKPAQNRATLPQERRSKYRAVKTEVDGVTFDSKAEARRYAELLTLGRIGAIRNLELHPHFPLTVNGWPIGTYVGDFRYEERIEALYFHGTSVTAGNDWRDVVEDVKGMKTPVYRLKRKLMSAQYGIQIRETR